MLASWYNKHQQIQYSTISEQFSGKNPSLPYSTASTSYPAQYSIRPPGISVRVFVHMVVMISLGFPLCWKGVSTALEGWHVRSLWSSPGHLDHHCLKSRAGAIRADHFLFPLAASQRDLTHELRPAEIKTWIMALTGAGTLKWKPV